MANIVLVHGAFHGGWCWREVARPLRRAGHEVFCPTLTGLGDRAHLLSADIDLDTHIEDIVRVVECEELEDVILLAHSYGGLPVTGAAERLLGRLRGLVYLDAFTPSSGESGMEIRGRVPGAVPLTPGPDGISLAPPPAKVFGVADKAAAAWLQRRMTPQPLACMTQPIRLAGTWKQAPEKLYIRLGQYPAPYFDAYHETWAADPAWRSIVNDKAHNVMVTEPAWLIDTLSREFGL